MSCAGEDGSAPYRCRVTATTEAAGDLPGVSAASPVLEPASVATPSTTTAAPPGAMARLVWRTLDLRGQGLTAPGGILLAVVLVVPGVAVDWVLGGSFGAASSVAFVLASVAAAAAVRVRAMATAAVLPPLLFAGALTILAWVSGANDGAREMVLDVGTTLAVSAPTLFLGTAAAMAVVVGRLVVRLVRR